MTELAAHLRALRTELVERMARELDADSDWAAWLALLATVETAIQAVEAVMEERAGPPPMRDNASSLASENAPERP